jgi:hypothetical protein
MYPVVPVAAVAVLEQLVLMHQQVRAATVALV